jgi:hypothetical protein
VTCEADKGQAPESWIACVVDRAERSGMSYTDKCKIMHVGLDHSI